VFKSTIAFDMSMNGEGSQNFARFGAVKILFKETFDQYYCFVKHNQTTDKFNYLATDLNKLLKIYTDMHDNLFFPHYL